MRSLGIAYLHLVLLGVVTPILMAAALDLRRAPALVAVYAAGLALMLLSLLALGLPAIGSAVPALGLTATVLFRTALAGGALCAAAATLHLRRPLGRAA